MVLEVAGLFEEVVLFDSAASAVLHMLESMGWCFVAAAWSTPFLPIDCEPYQLNPWFDLESCSSKISHCSVRVTTFPNRTGEQQCSRMWVLFSTA